MGCYTINTAKLSVEPDRLPSTTHTSQSIRAALPGGAAPAMLQADTRKKQINNAKMAQVQAAPVKS
jgi:hypothetical protein